MGITKFTIVESSPVDLSADKLDLSVNYEVDGVILGKDEIYLSFEMNKDDLDIKLSGKGYDETITNSSDTASFEVCFEAHSGRKREGFVLTVYGGLSEGATETSDTITVRYA